MLRTTEDCVRGEVQGLEAFGEHCTQGQDQNGVNGECVTQMLLQQEPLQDEPGRRYELLFKAGSHQTKTQALFISPDDDADGDEDQHGGADQWVRHAISIFEYNTQTQ